MRGPRGGSGGGIPDIGPHANPVGSAGRRRGPGCLTWMFFRRHAPRPPCSSRFVRPAPCGRFGQHRPPRAGHAGCSQSLGRGECGRTHVLGSCRGRRGTGVLLPRPRKGLWSWRLLSRDPVFSWPLEHRTHLTFILTSSLGWPGRKAASPVGSGEDAQRGLAAAARMMSRRQKAARAPARELTGRTCARHTAHHPDAQEPSASQDKPQHSATQHAPPTRTPRPHARPAHTRTWTALGYRLR